MSFEFAGVVAGETTIPANPNIVVIPEPGSLILFGIGLGLIAALRYGRK